MEPNLFHDLRYFSIEGVCRILAAVLIPLRHQVQRSLEGRLRYFTIQKPFADQFFFVFLFLSRVKNVSSYIMFSNVLCSERKRMILAFYLFCWGSNSLQIGQTESVLSRITLFYPLFPAALGTGNKSIWIDRRCPRSAHVNRRAEAG